MSSQQATLTDSLEEAEAQPVDGQTPVTTRAWEPQRTECRCGSDLTRWHTSVELRLLKRHYGDEDGRIPACPDCVDLTDDYRNSEMSGVAKAMKYFHRNEGSGLSGGNL